jgi:hypothetical protein
LASAYDMSIDDDAINSGIDTSTNITY